MTGISKEVRLMAEEAESSLAGVFNSINKTAERNTERVMAAFRRHSVSDTMFAGTTGYGYNDRGRHDQIYADVMGCEAGLRDWALTEHATSSDFCRTETWTGSSHGKRNTL